MARIKPAYSSRNFSPDRSQDLRACVLRINNESYSSIVFDFFDEYEADMPTKIFVPTITGYNFDSDNNPLPMYEYAVDELSTVDIYSGLSISDLSRYTWPRYRKPYGISALDFLDLSGDPEWFFTGSSSGNVFDELSSNLDFDTEEPQLNIVKIRGTHLPSQDFKGEVLSFFANIPTQTGQNNTGLFMSGTDEDFENYLSGIGVTGYSGSNYFSGSGYFSGYLSEEAYNSGSGFHYLNGKPVGQHVIYHNNNIIYETDKTSFDVDLGWLKMSSQQFDNIEHQIDQFSNFSGGFYLFCSGGY